MRIQSLQWSSCKQFQLNESFGLLFTEQCAFLRQHIAQYLHFFIELAIANLPYMIWLPITTCNCAIKIIIVFEFVVLIFIYLACYRFISYNKSSKIRKKKNLSKESFQWESRSKYAVFHSKLNIYLSIFLCSISWHYFYWIPDFLSWIHFHALQTSTFCSQAIALLTISSLVRSRMLSIRL